MSRPERAAFRRYSRIRVEKDGVAAELHMNPLARGAHTQDVVLQGDGTRIEDAYRFGNAAFSRGDLNGIFASRREMTDTIKAVENEHGLDDCPRCDILLSGWFRTRD